MREIAAILLVAGLSATAARAVDHLVPVESASLAARAHDDYASIVVSVFKSAFKSNVRARVYVTSAGPAETIADMLTVEERQSRYAIVYLHTNVPLWMYAARLQAANRRLHFPLKPADYHAILPEHFEAPISSALGMRIIAIWRKVLFDTRFEPQRNRGLDGEDYLFSMDAKYSDFEDEQELAGQTWSPSEAKLSGLVDMVYAMEEYARKPNAGSLPALSKKVASEEAIVK